MTVCASPGVSVTREQEGAAPPSAAAADKDGGPPAACAITADGAYAARLARGGGSWYPERWTLDGPEPYAVPLPGDQGEEPGTEVQPMGDGRVLIRRLVAGRNTFSLLYPTGPGTGELPLGAVECPDGTRLRLLPPAPGGERAYALAVGSRSSAVWLVAGGPFGPELLAEVEGHCSGGVWLDRAGRLLALDRRTTGRTKTVVVDLGRGGAVSPLLQIAPHSDDRLLLADLDSGLLLIRSDAAGPGEYRLGWGVLGSTLPVRFPQCLRLPDCTVTPFAIQPGQVLTPEQCAVALRCDGAYGSWVGVWRPAERRVRHLPAPEGWLAGAGLWTAEGVLRLPYATRAVPCGVARWPGPTRPQGAPGAHLALPPGPSAATGPSAPQGPYPAAGSSPVPGAPATQGPVPVTGPSPVAGAAVGETAHGAGRGVALGAGRDATLGAVPGGGRGVSLGRPGGTRLGALRRATPTAPNGTVPGPRDALGAPQGAERDSSGDTPAGSAAPGAPHDDDALGSSGAPNRVGLLGGSDAATGLGAPNGPAEQGSSDVANDPGVANPANPLSTPPTPDAPPVPGATATAHAPLALLAPLTPLLPLTPSGSPTPVEPAAPDPAGALSVAGAADTPDTPEAEVPGATAERPVTLRQAALTGRMTGHTTGRMAVR